jgi:hypothetical protein
LSKNIAELPLNAVIAPAIFSCIAYWAVKVRTRPRRAHVDRLSERCDVSPVHTQLHTHDPTSCLSWQLNPAVDRFFFFMLVLIVEAFAGSSLGLAISALAPNPDAAQVLQI